MDSARPIGSEGHVLVIGSAGIDVRGRLDTALQHSTITPGYIQFSVGGVARNIFVVLHGTLVVRDGDVIVNVLSAGDAFGEIAFLLERPRSFDVDTATDDTRILSLSEGALRKMIAEDATVAAKLLLNLSKMLCVRLIRAH